MEPIHPSVIKQPICLTSTTAPDWSEKEAFRELYQNWKDAIMQDHDLPPLGFPVVVTETDKEILITVTKPSLGDPTTTSYAGFICFKKTTGTIELTNFDSILDTKCLEIGYSSKVGDLRLIGHHGEGLKLAVLALSRRKYHIKLLANSCYWNFTFRGREERNLYYTVNPASREKTHRLQVKFARREEQSFPREFIANIWRDVSVVITRDSTVSRLNAVDFWTWMQITIDINPPPGLIRTLAGDLIVDEAYKGKIYVKGIRYEVCDGHDEGLMIGYNLGTGFINRERRIAICGVSQRVIAEIWARAIETGASSIVALYSQILMENPDATDVRDIEHMVNNETAKKVWSHLHEDAKARGLFYYPQNTKGLAAENIRTYLRLQPAPMPVALWRLLRKFQLISSTDEELLSRLKNTKMIQVPNTLFSRQVDRSLRGTLAAEEQTKALKVVYVEGWKGGLALGLIQGVLYVHQQWLDPGRMDDTCCPPAPVHDDAHFEHVIEDIISDALSLLHRHELLGSEDVSLFRRRALQRLHDMPRSVRATTVSGSVVVDWDVGHSLAFMEANGSLITYSVTLHGIQCLAERDSLLLSSSSCGCPTKDVLLKERNVVFDHHNSYITFPVVSRNQEKAILGIPPAPVPIYGKFGFIDRVEIPVNVPYGPVVELADSSNPLVSCDPAPEEFLTCDQQIQSDDESYVSKPLEQIDQVAGLNQFLDPWNASEITQGILTSPLSEASICPPKRTIKAQEYLSVTLNSSSGHQKYLLFVHEIIIQPGEDDLVDALKATKFSFLSDCCTTPPTTAVPGEVVLHFHDFAILGECSDADTVRFEELVSWDSSEGVKYTSQPDEFYHVCRFAVAEDGNFNTSWVPLLLADQYMGIIPLSYPPPRFSALPVVRAIGPEVMGCIEEAMKVGLQRGIEFQNDPQISECAENHLVILTCGSGTFSKISRETSQEDGGGESLGELLSPFDTVREILGSSQRPDFFFLLFPATTLLLSASSTLMSEIFFLLDRQYSVHFKVRSLNIDGPETVLVCIIAPPGTDPQLLDSANNQLVRFGTVHELVPAERASSEPLISHLQCSNSFDITDTPLLSMEAFGQMLGETLSGVFKTCMQTKKRRGASSPLENFPVTLKRARPLMH